MAIHTFPWADLECSSPARPKQELQASERETIQRRRRGGRSCYNPSYMFKGLEHTAIASPDPQKLARWYVDYLGFNINYEYAGNYFVKAANGTLIEIIPSEGAPMPQKLKDPGIRHLAISVDDFDAAHVRLKELGVKFLTEPYEVQGNRLVFFTDSDGNILHLIRREKPLP